MNGVEKKERRDKKKRKRMPVHGTSVKVLEKIIANKAEKERKNA